MLLGPLCASECDEGESVLITRCVEHCLSVTSKSRRKIVSVYIDQAQSAERTKGQRSGLFNTQLGIRETATGRIVLKQQRCCWLN